jgi:hypothetical protein
MDLTFASAATGVGNLEIFDRVPAIYEALWANGFSGHSLDHRYYRLVHETLGNRFVQKYALLRDDAGEPRAIQPYLVVQQDLTVGLPIRARSLVDGIRRAAPNFLSLRMIMIGCSAGEGDLASDRAAGDFGWTGRALGLLAPEIAGREGASLIVFKEFQKRYRPALNPLLAGGYTRIPSMPATRLRLNYASFEEYLTTRLSHNSRKSFRRKLRKVASQDRTTVEVVNDLTPWIGEAFPLYRQVFERSRQKFEELTPEYFSALGQQMPDRARFFIWRRHGRIVAFSSCLVHGDVLYDNYLGMDYEVALRESLYFVTWRDIISWAIENRLSWYYSTPLSYEPKYHLRLELAPLDLYVRASNPLLNTLFKVFLPWLEPTRYDRNLRKFANAHEMR